MGLFLDIIGEVLGLVTLVGCFPCLCCTFICSRKDATGGPNDFQKFYYGTIIRCLDLLHY